MSLKRIITTQNHHKLCWISFIQKELWNNNVLRWKNRIQTITLKKNKFYFYLYTIRHLYILLIISVSNLWRCRRMIMWSRKYISKQESETIQYYFLYPSIYLASSIPDVTRPERVAMNVLKYGRHNFVFYCTNLLAKENSSHFHHPRNNHLIL